MHSIWTYDHTNDCSDIRCLGQADTYSEANALALTLDYDPADLWLYDHLSDMEISIKIPAS